MEQEKIGKFISLLRKEKNMTQMELASKLGVTDRAISKWENGRGMPDLSLLKPLCDELGITINDLLSGEKIDKINYQEKLEENILNTIDYTNKKIKKNSSIFKKIISLLIMSMMVLLILFGIDVKRMNNREPVLFSTWGFDYAPPINLQAEEIELAIKDYIIKESDSKIKHNNEKSFVSMKVYLIEENKSLYNVYAWVLEEKYYLENNEIKQDSGSSIPHKFIVKKQNNNYIVTDYVIPRDGSYYPVDMKKIFPSSVRIDMEKVYKDGTIERLSLEIKEQTKLYFHNK